MITLEFTDEEMRFLRRAVFEALPTSEDASDVYGELILKLDEHYLFPAGKEEAKKDRRDPQVTELVEHFERLMELTMPRPQYQRRAAKTLIQRVGLERAKKGVEFAKSCRRDKYAPVILSLEDLRDKWNKLGEFYGRAASSYKDMDAIRSMTRGK